MEVIEVTSKKWRYESFVPKDAQKARPTIFSAYYLDLFTSCSIDIFTFVFGEKWTPAGEFVQIMTPIFFLRFVSFPR